MHTGPQLGQALKAAMTLKGVKQDAVAAEFGIKQPSVSEWTKLGRIGKKHIPRLVKYFEDVVGPEHWGLPPEWASSGPQDDLLPLRDGEPDVIRAFRLLEQPDRDEITQHVLDLVMKRHAPTFQAMDRLQATRRIENQVVADALKGANARLSALQAAKKEADRQKHEQRAGAKAIHDAGAAVKRAPKKAGQK